MIFRYPVCIRLEFSRISQASRAVPAVIPRNFCSRGYTENSMNFDLSDVEFENSR